METPWNVERKVLLARTHTPSRGSLWDGSSVRTTGLCIVLYIPEYMPGEVLR